MSVRLALFAIVHGRKAGRREGISAFESFFDQQFFIRQELQCRLVLLEVGTGEAQHLTRIHEKSLKGAQHTLFRW